MSNILEPIKNATINIMIATVVAARPDGDTNLSAKSPPENFNIPITKTGMTDIVYNSFFVDDTFVEIGRAHV